MYIFFILMKFERLKQSVRKYCSQERSFTNKSLLPLAANIFIYYCLHFKGTNGSGKLTVQLINYKNSASRDINGNCCDNVNWYINECDNYFRLCYATTFVDKCALWSGWTRVLGGDSFSFPGDGGSLGNGIVNPLTYSFTRWQVRT